MADRSAECLSGFFRKEDAFGRIGGEEFAFCVLLSEDIDAMSMNKELPFCRFCWVNDTSEENPLLSTCKCRGGVQYVHY